VSRLLRCNPERPEDSVLDIVAETLFAGGKVVLPTETQYGLAVRGDKEGTLDEICRLKRRDSSLRSALFVKDMKMAESFCTVSRSARELAECFLPGPLTLILPPRENQTAVSRDYLSPDGFGIRISSSPVVKGISNRIPFPISATSANISGEKTPPSIQEIEKLFGDGVDLYLDGGFCRATTPSTVVKVNGVVELLRPGQIPENEIMACLESGRRHE